MTREPTRGGARAGAGNPALGGQSAGESRNLVVRLPPQMHDQLNELAAQTGRKKSEVARELLARGLLDEPSQKQK